MKYIFGILFIVLGVLTFFISSGTLKLKDQDWTNKGAGYTGYLASFLMIVFGVYYIITTRKEK